MSSIGGLRLKKDYLKLKKDPIPYISAEPLPSNIFEWHYVIEGPKDSDYYGGFYHGYLKFSQEYPFKAPSIYMITPNGRFQCRSRLCLSISDFHQESWNPSWCVGTILTGLLSFMLEESPTFGSISSSKDTRWQFARDSLEFNLKDSTFVELFPESVKKIQAVLLERQKIEKQNNLVLSPISTNRDNSGTQNNGRHLWLENIAGGMNRGAGGVFGNPLMDNFIFFLIPIILCAAIAFLVYTDHLDLG